MFSVAGNFSSSGIQKWIFYSDCNQGCNDLVSQTQLKVLSLSQVCNIYKWGVIHVLLNSHCIMLYLSYTMMHIFKIIH